MFSSKSSCTSDHSSDRQFQNQLAFAGNSFPQNSTTDRRNSVGSATSYRIVNDGDVERTARASSNLFTGLQLCLENRIAASRMGFGADTDDADR